MKKLIIIILTMMFIGCSESSNSIAAFDFDQTDVENDSTGIEIIDTIDTIKEVKDTIIDTKKNNEESSNSNKVTSSSSSTKKDIVVVSSSSKIENKSSSSINNKKEESSSSIKKNESSSSEKVVVSSSSKENIVSSSSEKKVESSSSREKLVTSSSSELIVSSSSEKKVESSSSSKIVESSSSSEKVVINSSSSVNEDYIDVNEPKNTVPTFVELDELKLNEFRVENNIAYLSWENNTDYTMQINVTYGIGCNLVGVADSTIMYTIKANSVKEKAIYEIKNNAKKCVGEIKSITATKNDKSNFAGWEWGSDRGMKYITFEN